MEIQKLTDRNTLKHIYDMRMRKDFSANERKPFSAIWRSVLQDEYECYGLVDEDALLGYAFFVKLCLDGRMYYLLDYLAIDADRRDTGLGTAFLQRLASVFPDADCILVEVDDPDCATDERERVRRQRRLRFYLRNGYRDPGVAALVFGADYRILKAPVGAAHTGDEVRGIYAAIYRYLLPAVFFRGCFHLKTALNPR